MAKEIKAIIKLQCPAGKANPAPPVGPALGQHGVNIMEFCQSFNEQTKEKGDFIIPVEITVFADRSFTFILKQPPAAILIKKILKQEKGSDNSKKNKIGKLSQSQLEEIAKTKMPDLNSNDIESAKKVIAGTARSMGVEIEKWPAIPQRGPFPEGKPLVWDEWWIQLITNKLILATGHCLTWCLITNYEKNPADGGILF